MFNVITLVNSIKKIGQAIPNINTVVLSDIFELNSKPDVDYSVFAIIQDTHRQDDDFFYFNFVLYYVDRLLNDKSNQLEIQSHGIQLLSTVISKIEELGLIVNHDVVQTTYQTFTQRFSDECAGVFARVEIMVPVDCQIPYDVLVDPILANITITSGGTYNPKDYGADAFKTVTVETQFPDIWVKKDPTKSDEIVNLNDLIETGYYYIPAHTSHGGPIYDDWADAMLHTIKKTDDGISMIVQYYTTTVHDDSREWPRTYFRTQGWNMTQSAFTWSGWQEVATDSSAMMRKPVNIDHAIDFNDYNQSGYYCLKREFHNVNGPVPEEEITGSGILEVVMRFDEEDGFQRFTTTRHEKIYFRAFGWNDEHGRDEWQEWQEIPFKSEVSSQIEEALSGISTSAITALSAATVSNTQKIETISGNTYSKNEADFRMSQTAEYYYDLLKPSVEDCEENISNLSGSTKNIETLVYNISGQTVVNQAISNTSVDFNDLTDNRTYLLKYINGQTTNAPTGGINIAYVEVKSTPPLFGGDSPVIQQECTVCNPSQVERYLRVYSFNSNVGWAWSQWTKII